MNHVEPLDEFVGGRRVERHAPIDQFLLGPLQSLFDRLLIDQQGSCDLRIAEAASAFNVRAI